MFLKMITRLVFVALASVALLVSCGWNIGSPSFGPRDHVSTDDAYIFAAERLGYFFIYRDKLPDDLYAFDSPEELYDAVDEPYTNYWNREQALWLQQQLTTTVQGGVGIHFDTCSGGYLIKEVFSGSPGEIGGLKAGDTIVRVNDEDAALMTREYFSESMKGDIGTTLVVRIKRGAAYEDITLIRGEFSAPSVYVDSIGPSVAMITLTGFYLETSKEGGSAEEFTDALSATGWALNTIVDLRDNRGGYVDQCISIVSQLVAEGTPIIDYHERGIDEESGLSVERAMSYKAVGPGTYAARKLTLLVDRNTASASEIMASCLMQREGVTVIGENTYGKARGQYIFFEGPGGIAVKVTAMTFTPAGDSTLSYDMVGISPDIRANSQDAFDVAMSEIEGTAATKRQVHSGYHIRTFPHQNRLPMAIIGQ